MVRNNLQQTNNTTRALSGTKGFNALMGSDMMKNKIKSMVGSVNAQSFITSITSAVNNNPQLADCDSQSIVSAALLGQALNLPISPQLGYFYMVPFNDKKQGIKKAQFMLGYKGLIQLAIKSGAYKDLGTIEVREGELDGVDPLTGDPVIKFINDYELRQSREVVGYMAYLRTTSGFEKKLYWPKEKVLDHADQYSMAFNKNTFKDIEAGKIPDRDMWKYSSFWYKNFDMMAQKTVMRQLLSRYGLLSTDEIKAYEADNNFINDDLSVEEAPIKVVHEVPKEAIEEVHVETVKEETKAPAEEAFDPMTAF